MEDDPLDKFTSKHRPRPESEPTLPPSLVYHDVHGGKEYVPFSTKVRAMNVEVRCFSEGLSYSIAYAHMSSIVFEFQTGKRLEFSGGGLRVNIEGRNLGDILLALNLHVCSFIQDYSAAHHALAQPVDPAAPFIESIEVKPLRPAKSAETARQRAENVER